MRTTRQQYIDATYEEAIKAHCDTIQLKFDGWWFRIEIVEGVGTCYTRTGRPLPDFNFTLPSKVNATLIGEGMYGTNWSQKPNLQGRIFVFDIWTADGVDLEGVAFGERYKLLKATMPFLPSNFIQVANFNIDQYEAVWKMFVESGEFEGVVFRRRNATVGVPVLRQKLTQQDTYTALDFVEGEGKHAGRLGATVIGDVTGRGLYGSSGLPATVGGGWDDEEREEIWNNKEKYKGRKFEVEGRTRFPDSGLLRHPNFVRWKDV